ncbi:phosphoserine phosphatase SerB [Ferrimonas pelagia]|uniref:Phosphoserine phosphatase n=1 Tax=Ferrimonas pelagia TaxID=1177826 RepID=A0ABP9EIK0_9GAMM
MMADQNPSLIPQLSVDLLPPQGEQQTLLLLGPCLTAEHAAQALAGCGVMTPVLAEVVTPSLQRIGWQGQCAGALPPAPTGCELLMLPTQTPSLSEPGLLLMDMDSTMIAIECIDEIARRGGVYQQVAEVTELAMQGGLDFADSLRQRVAMLEGIPVSVMDEIAADLPLNPGLECLCQTLKARGWKMALASGGFNRIARVLAQQLGLDHFEANDLAVEGERLTGQITGPIVDAQRKAAILSELGQRYGIPSRQWLAIGDGANDLPMLAAAQLGVGYHAKPAVAAQADVAIQQLGLDAVLALLQHG